ncbi:MAG: zinc-binding dehydrogenase [Bifidobacteriaceae bacterium]|nr:zinc-binding dehydrogenase [Bifidobacteriaceae bacterium]
MFDRASRKENTMWAQSLIGPGQFELQDVPDLTEDDLTAGGVLVEFLAGGICGSDLPRVRGAFDPHKEAYGTRGWPFHEVVGRVIASRDGRHKPGSRVLGWALGFGGLAERFVGDGEYLLELDDQLSDVDGAVVQALAAVVSFYDLISEVAGKRVAVIGQGPYGILLGALAAVHGAEEVVGIDPVPRAEEAARVGINVSLREGSRVWARSLRDSDRPDIVIEAVGHQQSTLADAIEAVRPGGEVYFFGAPGDTHYTIPFALAFQKALLLRGASSLNHRRSLASAQALALEHPEIAETLATHVFNYRDAEEAFLRALTPKAHQLKIALTADGATERRTS